MNVLGGIHRRGALLFATFVLASAPPVRAQTAPPGFSDELLIGGFNVPTAFTFAPDGRIFVAEKAGVIRVVDNGHLLPAPALVLPVETYREQGILGIALDPQFPLQPFVYIVYTRYTGAPTDNFNRVSRFTVDGNEFDPASEAVLFDRIPTGIGFHIGGCIRFGLDGNLLVSTGDTNWAPPWPQDLSRLEGKLLRLHTDGTVPADNPFAGVDGALPEIYQYGLRNPFRFSVQPGTGLPFIADVGAAAWEEIDTGPPGANFGWPLHEGPADPPDSATVDPLFAYDHTLGSAAIVGNTFYTGHLFPAEFDGNYFFLDHSRGLLGRMVLGPGNSVVSADPRWLATPFSGPGFGPVDLEPGPDGALYYNTFVPGQIRRIAYSGSDNRRPAAIASASPSNGYAPATVEFSSQGSFDTDGDSLAYDWDFGDGSAHSDAPNPIHTYLVNGVFAAQVTVNDGRGADATSAPAMITIGNLGPDVQIATPAIGQRFADGETVHFNAAASDPELGSLPPEALHWRVFFYSPQHFRPTIIDQTGAGGSFVASFHGEEPATLYYTITAWAVDAAGLRTEKSVRIDPVPGSGGTLRLLSVPSTDRDAVTVAGQVRTEGVSASQPFDYVSSDSAAMTSAVQFAVDVPPGAVISEANLILRPAPVQQPSLTGGLDLRSYDHADCPPFVDAPGDLATLHPLTATVIPWPAFDTWTAGNDATSPDIAALVQQFIDRPDYATGQHLGLVLERGTIEPEARYGWTDFSAQDMPARLRIRYRITTATAAFQAPGFALQANVPNPFNPSTRIEFSLDRAALARLEILDVRGRLVRCLVNGKLAAGTYHREWNGRTTAGAAAASGVYVCRLTADGRSTSRRLVLVR